MSQDSSGGDDILLEEVSLHTNIQGSSELEDPASPRDININIEDIEEDSSEVVVEDASDDDIRIVESDNRVRAKEQTVVFTCIGLCATFVIAICLCLCTCLFIIFVVSIVMGIVSRDLFNAPNKCKPSGRIVYAFCLDHSKAVIENPDLTKLAKFGFSKLDCLQKMKASKIRFSFGMTNASYCYELSENIKSPTFSSYKTNSTNCVALKCMPVLVESIKTYHPPIESLGNDYCGSSSGQYMSIFEFEETYCEYTS